MRSRCCGGICAIARIWTGEPVMYLGEYRARSARLCDHLPWAILIGPGLVLNKDGSFQRTLEYRGPDLASATMSELVAARARLNNGLRRFGSRWCLHFEAIRSRSQAYPRASFPDAVSHLVDEERRSRFEAEASHFETRCFLTLTYLPPEQAITRAGALLVENLPGGGDPGALYRAALREFEALVGATTEILAGVMAMVAPLDDAQLLAHLHSCVSTRPHPVQAPPAPAYLDALLTDDDFQGGLSPRLGQHHLRVVSVRGYPSSSWPGMLDELNRLGLAYRWSCRFLPLDKEDARQALAVLRRRWFSKRKGVLALLKEAVTHEPVLLEDPDAIAKTQDADAALTILGGDGASLGYFTPTFTFMDRNLDRLDGAVRQAQGAINRAGFVAKIEDVNAVEAWLGGLPGQAYADMRRPLVSSLNLCDLLPLSAVWPGPQVNAHLTRICAGGEPQPPLMHVRTDGTTPFRLDLHHGDVGHTLVIGPTGAGKSVLLNTLALQWLRYPGAQVVLFDSGASARATSLAIGGRFHDLGGAEIAFQPLADLDTAEARTWAQSWLLDLLAREGLETSPKLKGEVWSGLLALQAMAPDQRTLTVLAAAVQDAQVKEALTPYLLGGPFGELMDASGERLAHAHWQAFEMRELMQRGPAAQPVLTYLFRRLERRFDGRPTLLVLDEAWLFLDSGAFAAKIREWLKTLRKRNVAVVFASQSLADIAGSAIAAAVIESCPTRIFLPHPDALSPQVAELYERFGLNRRQLEILASAIPKRDYYYQSPAGARLFELDLGPVALAAVSAATPADQTLIDDLLIDDAANFAPAFYRAKGLAEVADFLDELAAEVGP
jgi:type IV secretion system protein TrbE